MKKSIKIIILSIILVFMFAINSFAYTTLEYYNMTREEVIKLQHSQIEDGISKLKEEYYGRANHPPVQGIDYETLPSKIDEFEKIKESAEHFAEQDKDSIESMSRNDAKQAIGKLNDEIKKINNELSSFHNGSAAEVEYMQQLQEKSTKYSNKLKEYKSKIDQNDIYYYMDNMSSSSDLYRQIEDLTEKEIEEAEKLREDLMRSGSIGTYTTSEINKKQGEYRDRVNILQLVDAIKAGQDKKYRESLTRMRLGVLRRRLDDVVKELEKMIEKQLGSETLELIKSDPLAILIEYQLNDTVRTYVEYITYIDNIQITYEEKEAEYDLERAIYYANNIDKARELTLSQLKYYHSLLVDKSVHSSDPGENYKYKSYSEALQKIIEEKETQNALVDYNNYSPSKPTNYNQAINIAGNVIAILRNIGIVVAVISLSVIGIKYMIGSAEEKAEYKKKMIPFVVGVILFTAITSIVSLIYNIVNGIL